MLPSQNRLKKKKEIEMVFQKGRGFSDGNMYLKILKKKASSESRFAFVVGKKVSQGAVVRNRVRRRMSEVVRLVCLNTNIPPMDCVFVAKPGIESRSFEEIKKSVTGLLSKAGVI